MLDNRVLYVQKKKGFDSESTCLFGELKKCFGLENLLGVQIVNRYDIYGLSESEYTESLWRVFAQKQTDCIYDGQLPDNLGLRKFGVRLLPAQFDIRAYSAQSCLKLLTNNNDVVVISSRVYFFDGDISDSDFEKIKNYIVNPVDSIEIDLDKTPSFSMDKEIPPLPGNVDGFISWDEGEIEQFLNDNSMAMNVNDLIFCQQYFRDTEKRDPKITELKVIDTYWSDHCRHTTFGTTLTDIEIEDGLYSDNIKNTYKNYLESRKYVYGENAETRNINLMDMATIGMKELRKKGLLDNLDQSKEINACGIYIDVEVDGEKEPWILMFKNETHNHPTEIEPFGGAATCIGGAIRDPLSGRSYVFAAMRVTGSGDPKQKIEDTIKGKLPQRQITKTALAGYSSYSNQMGLAAAKAKEFYHPGFVAKRMECGAVMGAVPLKDVRREEPSKGDVIVLLGGETGRDGIGGATGSSKDQDETSLENGGSEVQKGNGIAELGMQRFIRNPKVLSMIKRCNDFGAGGVSVAIGELCDGLDIDLDSVPLKYTGMDATEIIISESQERMAMVVEAKDFDEFVRLANAENMDATKVAEVTDTGRLRAYSQGEIVVDIARDFLNTNGVTQNTSAYISAPKSESYFTVKNSEKSLKELFIDGMTDINNCSTAGIASNFDATVNSGTVLMPLGGKYQSTESDAIVMKIPVIDGFTDTAGFMAYGYDPYLMEYSPYLGSQYAVIESLSRLVAVGADYRDARLSFQEFFEKLGDDKKRWGKPVAALLGSIEAQNALECASVGGKDSMSGSYNDIDVPPTLISFAVAQGKASEAVSQDIKPEKGGKLFLVMHRMNADGTPNYESIKSNFKFIRKMVENGKAISCMSINSGGLVKSLSNMCYGNKAGVKVNEFIAKDLFAKSLYGSFLIQLNEFDAGFDNLTVIELGDITDDFTVSYKGEVVKLDEVQKADFDVLEDVFPTKFDKLEGDAYSKEFENNLCHGQSVKKSDKIVSGRPKVLIPVFPGTNSEVDMAKRFTKAGADVDVFIFRDMTPQATAESLELLAKKILDSQIVALAGGMCYSDEPDGSGKYIDTVFRNPKISDALNKFLGEKDGLMLGIGDGFRALIKLGLVPYGKIVDHDDNKVSVVRNASSSYVGKYINTKVMSTLSPWLGRTVCDGVYSLPVSYGEGKIVLDYDEYKKLSDNGQIVGVYCDQNGAMSYDFSVNPSGSYYGIEAMCSPDGKILGKMAHSDRIGDDVAKNIYGEHDQKIFEAGVDYFK